MLRIEQLLQDCRKLQQDALEDARRSADPVRAEIAREILAGRLTPRQAITNSAYREFFETRLAAATAYLAADDEERDRIAAADDTPPESEQPGAEPTTPEPTTPEPTTGATGHRAVPDNDDDGPFEWHSFVRG